MRVLTALLLLAASGQAMEMSGDCATEVLIYLPSHRSPISLAQLARLPAKDNAYPERLSVFLWAREARRGFHLSLGLNSRLLSPSFRHDYYHKGQRTAFASPHPGHFCYYMGTVDGEADSSVAINLCRGQINGMITIGEHRFEVESSPSGVAIVSPTFGEINDSFSCDSLPLVDSLRSVASRRRHRSKRGSEIPSYYGDYLDGKIRYVEMTMVNDHAMYLKYNQDLDLLGERTKQVANVVNAIYYPLNIRVVLVGMETWTEDDRITITEDGDATLNAFLHYRKTRLMTTMPSDNSQLLTNRNFETGVVGKALKGTMCSYEMSGGVNVDHHQRVVAVAATVAHEMGHNFGMEHDNDTCQCPARRCIMSPSSGGTWPPNWSSCSLEYLAHGLSHGADYCLLNKPGAWVGGAVCGNGLVEAGEECDCGPANLCHTACCNATTCTLPEGAKCGSGECCDLGTCEFKARTTECRAAAGECDLSEHCDGASAACPADVFKGDGVACTGGYCGRGKCGVRDAQCARLWGDSGRSSESICYDYNTQGTFQGNCGHNRLNKTYPKCLRKDVMCGRLHCRHENERTEFGFGVVAQTSHTVLRLGADEFAVCSVAMVDLGGPEDPDPGLVPDGAVCGHTFDKMCYKQQCMEPAEVRAIKACNPPDCNGRGICNANGNCHCHYGYSGKSCLVSGEGGSVDSGPTGPSAPAFTVGMGMILFSVIIILILAVLFLYWKKRRFMANNRILRYLLPKEEQERYSKPPPGPRRAPSIKQRPAPPPPTMIQPPVYPYPAPADGPVKISFSKPPPPINAIPVAAICPDTTSTPSYTLPRNAKLDISAPMAASTVSDTGLRGATESRLHHGTATLPRNKPPANYNLYGSRAEPVPEPMVRQPSARPTKPAPPRPQRPPPEALDELYKERENTPSPQEGDGLLGAVMSELRKRSESPLTVEPPDPDPALHSPSPLPQKPSPPPDDPPPTTMTSSLQSRRNFFEAPSTGKVASEQKMTSSSVLPRSEFKPSLKGALPPPPPPPPAKVAVTRSNSSASSSEGKSRPKAAPPPPPPASSKPKLGPPIAQADEEEENYYDVILTPQDERPKPPLPSKPPKLTATPSAAPRAASPPKPPSKVSNLAARFDSKSGNVQAAVLPH